MILIDNDGEACQHVPQVRTMFTRDWNDANVRIAVTNTDGVKDANDMLVNGVKISDLEMDSIDMFTLRYMLSISTNLEQEYRQSQQFCRQVNNEMIKSDIAEFLAKRWAKPVEEVRKYLDVPRDTKDELIAKQHDIFDCLADYEALCESEGKGIGWLPLDETMDGCRAREVLVLSGYTSAGKSTCEAAELLILLETINAMISAIAAAFKGKAENGNARSFNQLRTGPMIQFAADLKFEVCLIRSLK